MSLLQDIQAAVLDDNSGLASALLRLRLLASRLDSEPLALWVRQELEGYSAGTAPPYRVVGVAHRGTFIGPGGGGWQDVAIPPVLIRKVAGERWLKHEVTENISAISQFAQATEEPILDRSNLALLLHGIYDNHSCNQVVGVLAISDMKRIVDVVRGKVLDFTIAIEKAEPSVRELDVSRQASGNESMTEAAKQIIQQTFYGDTVVNNVFQRDLEQIFMDRLAQTDRNEGEKAKVMDLVKKAGVQEVVKQFLQKTPDLIKFLVGLPQ